MDRTKADIGRTPVILVHGWAGSSRAWDRVSAELITAGVAGPVLAVDLPGSPSGGTTGDPTIPNAVDHVISIAESLSSPAVLVGHSMGGQITLRVHARRPDLVAAEVVLDPAYGAAASDAASMAILEDAIRSSGPGALVDFFESGFGQLDADNRETILADLHATGSGVLASYLRSEYLDPDSIGFRPSTEVAAALRTRPLLAIHSSERAAGIERELLPPPGSVVQLWHGHGHFLHLEDPERFAHVAVNWLRDMELVT